MPFSDTIVEVEFKVADGKCGCVRSHTQHMGRRCNKLLDWNSRGRVGAGGWEAHHKDGNPDNDSIVNCAILCWDCHALTF